MRWRWPTRIFIFPSQTFPFVVDGTLPVSRRLRYPPLAPEASPMSSEEDKMATEAAEKPDGNPAAVTAPEPFTTNGLAHDIANNTGNVIDNSAAAPDQQPDQQPEPTRPNDKSDSIEKDARTLVAAAATGPSFAGRSAKAREAVLLSGTVLNSTEKKAKPSDQQGNPSSPSRDGTFIPKSAVQEAADSVVEQAIEKAESAGTNGDNPPKSPMEKAFKEAADSIVDKAIEHVESDITNGNEKTSTAAQPPSKSAAEATSAAPPPGHSLRPHSAPTSPYDLQLLEQQKKEHEALVVQKAQAALQKAAEASSKQYGGTYPFYTSSARPGQLQQILYPQAYPPMLATAGYLASSTPSLNPNQLLKESRARPSPQHNNSRNNISSYSSYPPVRAPTTSQIVSAIPENASAIFHILDRRINFDNYPPDASFYSLLRGWVWDDPYRSNPPISNLVSGRDWAPDEEDMSDNEEGKKTTALKKRKRRSSDENMKDIDVLAMLKKSGQQQKEIKTLASEHVAWAKKIRSDVRRLDREKMERAKKSLHKRYGIAL